MNFRYVIAGLMAFVLSACGTIPQNTAPKGIEIGKSLMINNLSKKNGMVPIHSYPIGDSGFLLVQTQGGSIFLGPLLGSLNISQTSKEMAEKIRPELSQVSPYALSKEALLAGGFDDSVSARLEITPFVIVQRCEDNSFRLSLVHHVIDNKSNWIGRYIYHIEKPIKIDDFVQAIRAPEYKNELQNGAMLLVGLMKRDFAGELADVGQKYNIGSLHLAGEKLGGFGIYTMPEKLYFTNASVLEQTNDVVIVRMQGGLEADPAFGGLNFGVHYFKRSLLHKFESAPKG